MVAMKIYAPFAGTVRYAVADGDTVRAGEPVAIVEAMKLEAPVLAPAPGIVRRVIHEDFVTVAGGDELLQIEAAGAENAGTGNAGAEAVEEGEQK